ncbi:uncharacterized protein BCR38DRAFT_489203 [Pseudomassariella vexata]|uniref:Uncharacterized protein n=1 Tax=Pseudomassariella vexata TaxID=1141098 RepID=A0A1Y2DI79_9PEZI|nr:uncharacterized protein BCR38DRAFT_489203 [Pseudomassariella vexata]ORY58846.1 hypothetical protein BCR38DRAFT_489203 [Pseudomassariella vexata]
MTERASPEEWERPWRHAGTISRAATPRQDAIRPRTISNPAEIFNKIRSRAGLSSKKKRNTKMDVSSLMVKSVTGRMTPAEVIQTVPVLFYDPQEWSRAVHSRLSTNEMREKRESEWEQIGGQWRKKLTAPPRLSDRPLKKREPDYKTYLGEALVGITSDDFTAHQVLAILFTMLQRGLEDWYLDMSVNGPFSRYSSSRGKIINSDSVRTSSASEDWMDSRMAKRPSDESLQEGPGPTYWRGLGVATTTRLGSPRTSRSTVHQKQATEMDAEVRRRSFRSISWTNKNRQSGSYTSFW